MLSKIKSFIDNHVLLTNMLLSGTLGVAGDGISQLALEKRKISDFDCSRSIRFFVVPCFYVAPVLVKFFPLLNKVSGSDKTKPLKMIILEQLCFAPIFSSTVFISFRVSSGFSFTEGYESLKREFIEMYKTSLQLWPLIQLINYYIIPSHYRVFITQLAALGRNIFISYKLNKDVEKHNSEKN
uniref:Mitochondrial inner membrane protein Mpv17 n=1 Tax=Parastrongyloides trichosuri TaxID=131310 RepID=A0A0N5A2A0_PARTI